MWDGFVHFVKSAAGIANAILRRVDSGRQDAHNQDPVCAQLRRHASVSRTTAFFATAYAAIFACPCRLEAAETLTIAPPPAPIIAGTAAFAVLTTLIALRSNMRRHRSSGVLVHRRAGREASGNVAEHVNATVARQDRRERKPPSTPRREGRRRRRSARAFVPPAATLDVSIAAMLAHCRREDLRSPHGRGFPQRL